MEEIMERCDPKPAAGGERTAISEGVLQEFLALCAIPHQSGHEKAISDYLCRRAGELGYRAVHLLCDARNVIAHGLYTGAGYRYVCNAPLYGHEYEVFEKPLREP